MKIAFVGLGNMGMPMAKNLLKAGHEVYGLNRSKAKEEAFAAAGGRTGLDLPALAQEVDVLVTCLPMPADVEAVYLGDRGVIQSGRKGLLLIDFSTISPELARKVGTAAAEAGMKFLDAPVSGGTTGAEQGTLAIMVGGDAEVYEQALPVLKAVGTNIYHVGSTGSGTVVKLLNQLMVGFHTQAASEAMALADRVGVSKEIVHQILSQSFAQSRIYDRHYTQFVAKDTYQPGFALNLLLKDLTLAEQMAASSGALLPIGSQVKRVIGAAVGSGLGDKDMSGMYLHMKQSEERQDQRKYFAVLLPMKDEEKSVRYRPEHVAFLDRQRELGRLFANGRFADGAGGMAIYIAQSEDEVRQWVQEDPYIVHGARSFEIHEWKLVKGQLF
jgi:3-hydroxyisobutyrate dehydrogenase-like beta-hydroxyacid dehydrogenase/uncharacterized protein YciI